MTLTTIIFLTLIFAGVAILYASVLSTGQKLNGAELGVKERLGRSNEKAA